MRILLRKTNHDAHAKKPERRNPVTSATAIDRAPVWTRAITDTPVIQTRLTINAPGDRYEREADRVADRVMRQVVPEEEDQSIQACPQAGPITPLVQRQVDPEEEEEEEPVQAERLVQRQVEEEEEEPVQAKGETVGARPLASGVAAQVNALRGGGRPLPEGTRAFFEPRFGHDFSDVRVHTGPAAADTAMAMRARAYTVGRDVVFGAGEYAPETHAGQKLIAHELTHVIQQRSAPPNVQRHGNHATVVTARDKYLHTLRHAGTNQRAWERNLVRNATFLGFRIASGVHQELLNRLVLAENHLRGLPRFRGQTDAQILTALGIYSISGLRTPGVAVSGSRVSFHAFGLAIDVNYAGNPFIARSAVVARIIMRATDFILGRRINVRAAPGRSTLEQLRTRYATASNALVRYFSFRLPANRVALGAHLISRGFPADNATINRWQRRIRRDYTNRTLRREFAARDPAAGFIDLPEDLVVALGRHGGLLWGGQYQGGKDIMHFDWRGGTIRNGHRV